MIFLHSSRVVSSHVRKKQLGQFEGEFHALLCVYHYASETGQRLA